MRLPSPIVLVIILVMMPVKNSAALCGDCDGSSTVTILDALLGAQHGAGLVVLSGVAFNECDVDSSGAVDVLDALRLAQTAAGLPVVLVCAPFNQTPALSFVHVPPLDHAMVPFYLQISDAESDIATIDLEFSSDSGATWAQATAQAGISLASPTTGLTTTPAGVDHVFVWDSWIDAPTANGAILLRGHASDAAPGAFATVAIALQNGTLSGSYAVEAIPLQHRWTFQQDVDFVAALRNLTTSQVHLDFTSSCQFHWLIDGAAFDSSTAVFCLFVFTDLDIPASGVFEWPLAMHTNSMYSLAIGAHTITVKTIPTSGTVFSAPVGILVN